MDIAAYVRKSPASADRHRSVLQDILEGTLYSPFILIIDNAANSSFELLQNIKKRETCTLEAHKIGNGLSFVEKFTLLKDLTVELILNSNETIRALAIAIKSCSGTKQAKQSIITD